MPFDHQNLRCPISQLLMLNPVFDACGEVYEREEIETWFNQCQKEGKPITSPHTNETLANTQLVPAKIIKSQVMELLEKEPKLWSEAYLSQNLQMNFKDAFQKK